MYGRLKKIASRSIERLHKRRKPLAKVPVIADKKFLFIGGLHRSGTSILHRLLCEHPLTSGFSDTGVAEDEGQHLQTVFDAAHRYGGPGEFAFYLDAHLTERSSLVNPANRDKLLCEWGAYYDLDKPVLLEKSPPNLIRSRFLRQMLPTSKFVFLVRHPVAVSIATEKWSRRPLIERLLHWCVAHSIMLDDIDGASDCLTIRYEDFVDAPLRYLDTICDRVGIAHFAPVESVEDHNERYFQDWKRRYDADVGTLQAVLRPHASLLERFGYSLDPPFVHAVENVL